MSAIQMLSTGFTPFIWCAWLISSIGLHMCKNTPSTWMHHSRKWAKTTPGWSNFYLWLEELALHVIFRRGQLATCSIDFSESLRPASPESSKWKDIMGRNLQGSSSVIVHVTRCHKVQTKTTWYNKTLGTMDDISWSSMSKIEHATLEFVIKFKKLQGRVSIGMKNRK